MRRLWLYGLGAFLAGFVFSGSARGDTTELVTYYTTTIPTRFHRAHADSVTIGNDYKPESLPDNRVPAGNLLVEGNTHTSSLSVGIRPEEPPYYFADQPPFPGIGDVFIPGKVRIGESQLFAPYAEREGVRLDVVGSMMVGGPSSAVLRLENSESLKAWKIKFLYKRFLTFQPFGILTDPEEFQTNAGYPLVLIPPVRFQYPKVMQVGINIAVSRFTAAWDTPDILNVVGSANVDGQLNVQRKLGIYDGPMHVMGNVTVKGAIFSRGQQLGADYVFRPGYPLESIEEHAAYMWENGHLKALPVVSPDAGGFEVVDIVQQQRGILEELEKAHIYIDQMNKRLAQQQREIDALKAKR